MFINIFKKNIKKDKRITSLSQGRGFTLLEILIAMAIFSLIMIAIGSFARDIFYYEDIFSSGLTSYDEARKILQPITSEIRSASPSSLGSYPLETTDDMSFVFFTDINNDGLKEKIRYFLLGDSLMKGVIIPSGNPLQYLSSNETVSEIIHGIRNGSTSIFTYYDDNYDGITPPLSQPFSVLSVRLVKITLVIDNDPNKPPAPVTATTQVSIRNLKDNL